MQSQAKVALLLEAVEIRLVWQASKVADLSRLRLWLQTNVPVQYQQGRQASDNELGVVYWSIINIETQKWRWQGPRRPE